MPVRLTHENVRNLAKHLREVTGRDIKHTEIIDAIARALGRRPDAMMHELKHETPALPVENAESGLKASILLAKESGFAVWDTGGGCQAFGKVLKEEPTPDGDKATLEVMITVDGGVSIDAGPDEKVWFAGVTYEDMRGGDSVLCNSGELQTLHEAVATAILYGEETDRLWNENFDAAAIEEYLDERNERNHGM